MLLEDVHPDVEVHEPVELPDAQVLRGHGGLRAALEKGQDMFEELRIYAEDPPIRLHDLRHFCATQLLELGLDHFAVSVQLGHEGRRAIGAGCARPARPAAKMRIPKWPRTTSGRRGTR